MSIVTDITSRVLRGSGKARDENDRLLDGTLPDDPADDAVLISLPPIRVTADLHKAVDLAVMALQLDGEIYQRDGQLVRVVRVAAADAEREGMAAGTPQIRQLPIATLRERLTRIVNFQRFDGRSKDWVQIVPPDRVLTAIAARGEWDGVRPMVGVIETPSMRPNGTVIDELGYDRATGYVYLPRQEYPAVPQRPTQKDAQRALAELAEPWADFPFRSEADRFVPIAALMTLVARPAIRGAVPAFAYDASTRGSGKTLMARATTTLAHGREAALMSWPPDDAEREKILGGYALRGAAVIVWDNVTGTFGGGPLDKVLTCADRTELRILGESTVPSLEWRAVTIATGNNMIVGGDTTRRILVSRIEPQCERPEERTDYAIRDLPAWCRENHPRLVISALTLLRAYVVAGRPSMSLAGWGSYEAWRDLIASSIAWAGGADVMATRPTIAGEDDSETAALRVIIDLWQLLAPDGSTLKAALGALYPPMRRDEQRPPDAYESLRDAFESLAPPRRPGEAPSAQKLGTVLGRFRRRVVGGHYLDTGGQGERGGVCSWVVREVRRAGVPS